jgi:branched-chain amino acid transport system ATP-binding protein
MLEVKNMHVEYGKVVALHDVSFTLQKGEILSIIGSNGAGKTTLLNAISAQVKNTGDIILEGKPLSRVPHRVVKSGIVQVPEGRKIFAALTVEENLLVGAYLNSDKKEVEKMIQEQFKAFPILEERKKQLAGMLSGGEQQMLAIARGMMSRPSILLLDEPSLGLAPKIVASVFQTIKSIQASGITVLLVEQNAVKALGIADHAIVLENGKITKTGSGAELMNDPKIAEAYLGTKKRD